MGFDSVETETYNSGVPATRPFVVEQASAPVRLSSARLRTPGHTALVLSIVGNRTYALWRARTLITRLRLECKKI